MDALLTSHRDQAGTSQPEVRAFWTGPALSPYEELSLRSFVATGARVLLYSPQTDLRVPDGVELVDVREILSGQVHQWTFADGDRSLALHSDLFRYLALARYGGWYADLDIICRSRTLPDGKVYIARESEATVNGAVLKFPAQSPVIHAAIEESWALLPETRAGAPSKARVSIGPALLTKLAGDYAFEHLVLPRSRAYEIGYDEISAMFDPLMRDELEERTANSDFIHLWNEIWRRTRIPKSYGPPDGSFLDGLFKRFGMTFPDEARLSAETIDVWFRERRFLTQVQYFLQTEVIPQDAFNALRVRFRKAGEQPVVTQPPVPRHAGAAVADADVVRTLWQGGPIGPYQLLGLKSFADRGIGIEMFTYDDTLEVPEWIERRDASEIVPPERVLRRLADESRSAINAGLFRHAVLHQLGGWWIDPDVVLLRASLPTGELFCAGPTEFNLVSTAALKFPAAHPALTDALIHGAQFEGEVADWETAGAPLLTQCLAQHPVRDGVHPAETVSPISWFDVPRLFDPAQAQSVAEAVSGRSFLDLHIEVWLRAGIPPYLGPPRGSYLDGLFRRHDVGLVFPAHMEFDDVRRWVTHMLRSAGLPQA